MIYSWYKKIICMNCLIFKIRFCCKIEIRFRLKVFLLKLCLFAFQYENFILIKFKAALYIEKEFLVEMCLYDLFMTNCVWIARNMARLFLPSNLIYLLSILCKKLKINLTQETQYLMHWWFKKYVYCICCDWYLKSNFVVNL